MSSLISPYEFTEVTHQLRSFFDERGFQEVHTQNRLSILAACEDPTTVATYEYSGQIWPEYSYVATVVGSSHAANIDNLFWVCTS